ncbi:MAG: transglutaminase family protein, partial [Planctomycetes bacterium]|nr:transglutaminase family protein [Planctomycetota bacterium]
AEARLGAGAASRPAPSAGAAQSDGPPPDWLRAERKPGKGESAAYVVRTALCVEPRGGILNVFMPPVPYLEDYLELVTAIEDTAAATGLPVLIEGYTPPRDSRVRMLAVTPDPGVIEVNIHPAASWRELVDTTTVLYDEARQTRLGTEKFMLDGRHTGTGGGNHVTMGGATPADSPFLRRPDLLRSLLAYWHNHPALSYLFSGLFIGATSQAPRPDEARTEITYELQLALDQIPDHGKVPPWLIDRILRHVLVDVTGNTHRTQFSIDKLYMPDSATGRLGLLELRAFEMPPHARMSLASQLLLRGLVSQFWQKPYKQKLARWGMQLQDRFMLPHFLELDFNDVLADLGDGGYGFKPEWFAPHVEFRFPRYGEFVHRGIHFELRGALEPWHVLGEEASAGGTSRYVDSSLERMQVKVLGMTGDRHVVACNGVPLPLHPTGTATEFVAGVRFRTNLPPSCLHPTINAHAPLVFDLVDTWNKQVVAGCTYHVDHPGGRNYPQFPVNANAAEARRHARFSINRHSPGSTGYRHLVTGLAPARDPEFPFTLDLRQTRG